MINTTTLTQEAEAVLLELFNANLCSICSLETLRKLHHGAADLRSLLDWLLDYGYISRSGGDYELTFSGSELARQLQAEAQGSQFEQPAARSRCRRPTTRLSRKSFRCWTRIRCGAERCIITGERQR